AWPLSLEVELVESVADAEPDEAQADAWVPSDGPPAPPGGGTLGGGPGGGPCMAEENMLSRPELSSEVESSPSPSVSRLEKALAMELPVLLVSEVAAASAPDPRAVSMSDRLSEPFEPY